MIHTHSIILSQATHFQDEVAEYKIIADRGFQPKIHPKHVVLIIIPREKKIVSIRSIDLLSKSVISRCLIPTCKTGPSNIIIVDAQP